MLDRLHVFVYVGHSWFCVRRFCCFEAPLSTVLGLIFSGHEAQIHLGGDVIFGKMVEGCLGAQKGEIHQVGQEWAVRDCGRRLGDER